MHAGLLRPDSVAAPAHDEAAEVARELAEMPEQGTGPARVALVFDYASAWAWEIQPQGRDFSYFRLVFETYVALRKLGLNIDILPPDTADLSAYALVLAPGVATLSPELLAALGRHKGLSVIGPRANCKTDEFAIPLPLPPNLPGLDLTVARVESLPPDVPVSLAGPGALRHWREKVETTGNVVLSSADGWPALIRAGGLHYLAGWPDTEAWAAILSGLCAEASIATTPMPEGLRCRDTATHRFFFNYGAAPASLDGITIPAAGVVWSRKPG
jgi:beta-galactosidase